MRAKTRGRANRLVDLVFEQPVVNARTVERRLGLSRPSALNALRHLEDLGVLAAARERSSFWRRRSGALCLSAGCGVPQKVGRLSSERGLTGYALSGCSGDVVGPDLRVQR
jgi:hypothetical protein